MNSMIKIFNTLKRFSCSSNVFNGPDIFSEKFIFCSKLFAALLVALACSQAPRHLL